MRRQIGSVTTGHSPDKNQRSRDFRKRNGIVSGCYAIICACWSIGKQHTPHSRRMPSGILFFVEALQRISYTEYLLDILLYGEIEEKAALIAAQGKEVLRLNSEFQSLPPRETQEAVKRTMDTMNRDRQKSGETLENGRRRENSIRNCLTAFQHPPFRGAPRLNLLTEQIDIVKPLGWARTSTTLTDMDMNYLLLYLEENYGLTSEKKGAERHQDCCQ